MSRDNERKCNIRTDTIDHFDCSGCYKVPEIRNREAQSHNLLTYYCLYRTIGDVRLDECECLRENQV
jgi:hypothetical protein